MAMEPSHWAVEAGRGLAGALPPAPADPAPHVHTCRNTRLPVNPLPNLLPLSHSPEEVGLKEFCQF